MGLHDDGPVARAVEAVTQAAEPQLTALTEVPLPVTVRIGSARLTLGELLDLHAASVVVLDREIGDPAEIMVGERVVALGELVRVDSDLGVRITRVSEAGR